MENQLESLINNILQKPLFDPKKIEEEYNKKAESFECSKPEEKEETPSNILGII